MKSKKEKKVTQKLTPKQQRFCDEYLIDLNATQAAIRAGYSVKTAKSIGQENLTKPDVQEYIENKQERIEKRTEITQDMIVNQLARIAFGDVSKIMSWGPGGVILKPSEELTEDEVAMVAEASEGRSKTGEPILKLKTNDKLKALELLGRHVGMFNDKVKMTVVNETDEQLMAEANELLNTARARAAAANSGGAEEEES